MIKLEQPADGKLVGMYPDIKITLLSLQPRHLPARELKSPLLMSTRL